MTHPLAPLRAVRQWIIVRLVPQADGKTKKFPIDWRTKQVSNAHDPSIWLEYPSAFLVAGMSGAGHTIGFVLTAADPFWCLDIDSCLQPDGTRSPLALELCDALPGCVVEVSQSGAGLHIWGQGPVPEHACRNSALHIELYHEERFIAIGTGQTGSMSTPCLAIAAVVEKYFKPDQAGGCEVPDTGPSPEWRGPTNDDELIRRMLNSKSLAAAFNGKATLSDLWHGETAALARTYRGDPYNRSSADAALALHLAYWTGRDVYRIERLMRRSALVRSKWDERRDYYLIEKTIRSACRMCEKVLRDPLPPAAVPASGGPLLTLAPATDGTEDELALAFVDAVGQRYRWSAGTGWMVWEPPVWARDAGLTRFDEARALCRAAANAATTNADRKRLASAKTVAGVITLAQSDRRVVVADSDWDRDPWVLNTPGNMLDLRTGKPCDRSEHLPTQTTAVAPDFTADPPVFKNFLNDVFMGDADLIAFAQRVFGYSLTASTREQVLFFLHGLGANGKSTLVDLLMYLAGSYALKLPSSTLMANRHADAHPTGIAQLRGKRMAVCSELEEGQFFNESLLKELTGDETLTARFMRGDFFSFKQTQKHIVVGNYKPRLRGGDPALARRLVLVPFNAQFTAAQRDPDMLNKLKAEGPAVLAWAIRGAVHWHRDGLAIPESVRAASQDYVQCHDDLREWVDERCDREGETKAASLYSDFRVWKESRGEHAPSMTVWAERLQRTPGIERRKSNGVRYSPISIRPHAWGDQK